jgi:hypothetical protein
MTGGTGGGRGAAVHERLRTALGEETRGRGGRGPPCQEEVTKRRHHDSEKNVMKKNTR